MSEELNETLPNTPASPAAEDTENTEVIQESTEPSVEDKAREQGWVNKDEWKGHSDDHRTATEFVERGRMFARFEADKNKINALETGMSEMRKMLQSQAKRNVDQDVEKLETAKGAAIEAGDRHEVSRVEERIEQVRQSAPEDAPTDSQAVTDFKVRNVEWFNDLTSENSVMKGAAEILSNKIANTHPNLTEEQHLAKLEEDIKSTFKHRFTNPARSKPAAVANPSNERVSGSAKGKYTKEDLTSVQFGVYQSIKASKDRAGEKYEVSDYVNALLEEQNRYR